ncbi:hypothetical protein HMN09_00033400 [Mycena chlorophos]|uniref:Uncharacterized protein n=1 Tax=Mycena chlorophos TaxID=658473 RepID=A0A8H6TT13_MYCCL|nr:hypothetical protein HMN09_00033400 [Mycena chlorophos]
MPPLLLVWAQILGFVSSVVKALKENYYVRLALHLTAVAFFVACGSTLGRQLFVYATLAVTAFCRFVWPEDSEAPQAFTGQLIVLAVLLLGGLEPKTWTSAGLADMSLFSAVGELATMFGPRVTDAIAWLLVVNRSLDNYFLELWLSKSFRLVQSFCADINAILAWCFSYFAGADDPGAGGERDDKWGNDIDKRKREKIELSAVETGAEIPDLDIV